LSSKERDLIAQALVDGLNSFLIVVEAGEVWIVQLVSGSIDDLHYKSYPMGAKGDWTITRTVNQREQFVALLNPLSVLIDSPVELDMRHKSSANRIERCTRLYNVGRKHRCHLIWNDVFLVFFLFVIAIDIYRSDKRNQHMMELIKLRRFPSLMLCCFTMTSKRSFWVRCIQAQ
jgi:hypothetical protein